MTEASGYQMTIWDALARGHAGAERAADHAGPSWKDTAYTAFCAYARGHSMFTTEDVREASPNLSEPPDRRAWGQVAIRARREGVVDAAGFAPVKSSNGSAKVLWRSLVSGATQ